MQGEVSEQMENAFFKNIKIPLAPNAKRGAQAKKYLLYTITEADTASDTDYNHFDILSMTLLHESIRFKKCN